MEQAFTKKPLVNVSLAYSLKHGGWTGFFLGHSSAESSVFLLHLLKSVYEGFANSLVCLMKQNAETRVWHMPLRNTMNLMLKKNSQIHPLEPQSKKNQNETKAPFVVNTPTLILQQCHVWIEISHFNDLENTVLMMGLEGGRNPELLWGGFLGARILMLLSAQKYRQKTPAGKRNILLLLYNWSNLTSRNNI